MKDVSAATAIASTLIGAVIGFCLGFAVAMARATRVLDRRLRDLHWPRPPP